MSATIYGVAYWCAMSPDELTKVVKEVSNGNLYCGKDVYNKIKESRKWVPADVRGDSINIWSCDTDSGPIEGLDGFGIWLQYDEESQQYVNACVYYLE